MWPAKYRHLFSIALSQGLRNYKLLCGLSIFLITCLIIYAHLWNFIAERHNIAGFDPRAFLWYIALNEWVLISVPEIHFDMEEELRSGTLAYILPRPISYLGATFATGLATLIVQLIFLGVVTFVFSFLWTGTIPFTASQLIVSAILGVGAGIVGLLFQMLIGLSSFWLHDVAPLSWVWEKLLFVFGGLMLPLSTYPLWMQTVSSWTPFGVIFGKRSALAVQFSSDQVWVLTAAIIAWGVIATFLLQFAYRRGLRILNIQGG